MSKDIYLYKVKRIGNADELPEVVEEETYNDAYYFAYDNYAEAWEKEIGLRRKYRHRTINTFQAIEEITGYKVHSYRYTFDGLTSIEVPDGEGKHRRIYISPEQFEPYCYYAEDEVWFYEREKLFEIEGYRLDSEPYEDRLLTKPEIEKWLDEYVEKNSTECDISEWIMRPAWMLLLGLSALNKGNQIVFVSG